MLACRLRCPCGHVLYTDYDGLSHTLQGPFPSGFSRVSVPAVLQSTRPSPLHATLTCSQCQGVQGLLGTVLGVVLVGSRLWQVKCVVCFVCSDSKCMQQACVPCYRLNSVPTRIHYVCVPLGAEPLALVGVVCNLLCVQLRCTTVHVICPSSADCCASKPLCDWHFVWGVLH